MAIPAFSPAVFRITERTRGMLVASATGAQEAGADVPQPMVLATVNDDFIMTIPLAGSLYDRYQLERFSEWQAQDTVATYRITAESIWESQNAGIKIEQILAFLKVGRTRIGRPGGSTDTTSLGGKVRQSNPAPDGAPADCWMSTPCNSSPRGPRYASSWAGPYRRRCAWWIRRMWRN